MRVLVTGGAGYIGSVVTEKLVAEGHDVVVYDNLCKGHADAVPPGARLVRADLLDRATLRAALRDREAVVHLAAESLVGESMQEPARYYRSNVRASLALLDAMRGAGARDIVFSSTAAVYGEPDSQPIRETAPARPTSPYGETKLAVERALRWYGEAYGVRHVSLRYFNAAGASADSGERHEPETHLIPLVLDAARGVRREVVVFGDDYPTPDGTCVRDYIHVEDLARAHVLALEALARGDAASAVYNLGCGGRGHSVGEILDAARRVTGRRIPVRVGPRRAGDPAVLVASSDRAARALGWRPARAQLGDIIESAWAWLRRAR